MANRIGGRPDKKRLLPGVGYPIPISPAAAPSGGFASPVLLWPYGFGEATTAALTLSQSGSIGITGTTSVTGNLAWALSITQSGQVSVSGAITTSGNLVLDIGIGGTISPSGTLSLSGDLTYTVPALTLSQSGQIAITGSASLTGDVTITMPSLTLAQSGEVAVSGILSNTAAIGWALGLTQSGDVAVSGSLAASGDLDIAAAAGFRSAVALWPYGFGAGATVGLTIEQSGSISVTGAASLSGDITLNTEWEFVAPLEVQTIVGTLSASGDLSIGAPAALTLAQSGAIAVAGTLGATGNLSYAVALSQSGAVAVAGSVAASGDLTITPGIDVTLTQTGAIAASGEVALVGDLFAATGPFTLSQSGVIAVSGAAAVAGDISGRESSGQDGASPYKKWRYYSDEDPPEPQKPQPPAPAEPAIVVPAPKPQPPKSTGELLRTVQAMAQQRRQIAEELTRQESAMRQAVAKASQSRAAAEQSAIATIKGQLANMRDGGFISAHDFHIASLIADVVCGGDVDAGSLVNEEYLMSLERRHFCALLDGRPWREINFIC